MNYRRIIARIAGTLGAAGALALATGTAASADPNGTNPPHSGGAVTIHCEQLGELTAIQEGNGNWIRTAMPWHVLNSNVVLKVYAVHFVVVPVVGDTIVVEGNKP